MATNVKKLYRSDTDKIIFGVCGGLGEYFEIDPLIIRIIFIILAFASGSGVIIYLILAVLMPREDDKSVKSNKKNIREEAQKMTQDLVGEIRDKKWMGGFKDILGLIIVIVGISILVRELFKLDLFAWINWGLVFALLLIFLGFKVLSRQTSGK